MGNLSALAKSIGYRKKILKYIYGAKAGHTGGSLSCIDILNVLYNEIMNVGPENIKSPDRDRYIQSKGHCVEALFVVLADKGFFPESDLETLCRYKSHYIGHPTKKVNGVEQNTGALGHGLPLSVGTAIAAKLDDKDYKVFTLLGDGELPEGSNWEAALTAAHYKLDNLCAIIDHNKLQITGKTADVCNTDPIDQKFESFGWSVRHVDGHNLVQLKEVLSSLPFEAGKPSMVIAHTIKGKGISYMEHQIKWHHGVPSDQEYESALQELDNTLASS
ncbi:transketolase [Pedobacter heparinus]|uniref:Transketolase domain protein n=1 Tax=Pedobacter heparinus (strain ATCC 13125 / DSM 2366 / CIP 104194 / JCM 7457 / NBRC 12017 / NCIMB 9290 / NRRL B-14731 / HIM 762-3) TaxID=485917 RepID=C6Y171_PEDHD|nr:transketolase [Pedobacter heparinus]ACU04998.1 Transketolase domain protein [Pedobacter heparinus DSM 2366]